MVLGAHVSIAGGVHNAPQNALDVTAECIQIFSKNQRQWAAKPFTEADIQAYRDAYKESGLKGAMVHGSYLVNVAALDKTILDKSRAGLLDEAQRCEQLGIPYLNMHPGSHLGAGIDAGTRRIADAITDVLHKTQGSKVMVLLEFMAGQGTNIGDKFDDLAAIRNFTGNDKRVGYCFDTCHLYAAGYDITSPAGYKDVMKKADDILGLSNIKAFHLNDSKMPFNSHVDRHENVGHGLMGVAGFKPLMQDSRFQDAPMVLETPLAEKGYQKDLAALRPLRK
ncbi:MAG TPA: deoxyribonuclease IV [Candidatus Thermoplasmatota archaeon]